MRESSALPGLHSHLSENSLSMARVRTRSILSFCLLVIVVVAAWHVFVGSSASSSLTTESEKQSGAGSSAVAPGAKGTKIETEDVLARVGEKSVIPAELEAETLLGIANDLAYLPVEFSVGTSRLGSSITDKEGHAEFAWQYDKPQTVDVTVAFPGSNTYRPCEAHSQVFVLDDSRPIVIVDIDHTVADVSSLEVIIQEREKQKPLADAAETLNALVKDYQVIFLTHRAVVFAAKTKAWLRQNKFPHAPIIFWHPEREKLLPQAFKTKAIEGLKERFARVAAGIGDRKSDAAAYRINGLNAYILTSKKSKEHYPEGTTLVNGWKEIPEILKKDLKTEKEEP
jgi:hypothetical protein